MHTYARLCSTFDGNFWSQLPRWFVSRQWAGSILRVDVCSHLIKIWFWTAYLQHFEVQFTAVIASSVRQANKHINSSTIVGIRNWFNVAKKKKKNVPKKRSLIVTTVMALIFTLIQLTWHGVTSCHAILRWWSERRNQRVISRNQKNRKRCSYDIMWTIGMHVYLYGLNGRSSDGRQVLSQIR